MNGRHNYSLTIKWTGNTGTGTSGYRVYERSHVISVNNKPDIMGSSDPAFRGDTTKHNPEELLVASVSSCHLLWYLHVCAEAGVIIVDYFDNATGTMEETANGSGHFTGITLNPVVTVAQSNMADKAKELHKKANKMCFIANSVNFPVKHDAVIKVIGE
ncbi:MAG: OsmC family peroxiredoxin [Sphingobacteriales bacterium]|nr:MAG: OsmC family peroxiredoxin [Sphingobacteriales bacterium]